MGKISIKTIYWLLIFLLGMNIVQGIGKLYNPYYYNIFQMGWLAIILILFGLKLKVNKAFVLIFGLISLAVVVLLYLVIWN